MTYIVFGRTLNIAQMLYLSNYLDCVLLSRNKRITYLLTYFLTFVLSDVPDAYYYRTAKVGQTVKFSCPTKLPEDVDWVRVTSPPMTGQRYIYLGNLGMHYYWRDPRFTKSDTNHSHTLTIVNVMLNDSAYYRCAEDSGLGRIRFYHLTVEG